MLKPSEIKKDRKSFLLIEQLPSSINVVLFDFALLKT